MKKFIILFTCLLGTGLNGNFAQSKYISFINEGKTGIQKENKIIISPQYDSIRTLILDSTTYFVAFINENCGLINSKGKMIYSPIYQDIDVINNGYERLQTKPGLISLKSIGNNKTFFKLTSNRLSPFEINGLILDSTAKNYISQSYYYEYNLLTQSSTNELAGISIGDTIGNIIVDNIYKLNYVDLFNKPYYYIVHIKKPYSCLYDSNFQLQKVLNKESDETGQILLYELEYNKENNNYNYFPFINFGNSLEFSSKIDPNIPIEYYQDSDGNERSFQSYKTITHLTNGPSTWLDSNFTSAKNKTQLYYEIIFPFKTFERDLNTLEITKEGKTYVSLTKSNFDFDARTSKLYSGDPIIVGDFIKQKDDSILMYGLVDFNKSQIIPIKYNKIIPLLVNNEFIYKCINHDESISYLNRNGKEIQTNLYESIEFKIEDDFVLAALFNQGEIKPYENVISPLLDPFYEYPIKSTCVNNIYPKGKIRLHSFKLAKQNNLFYDEIQISIWNELKQSFIYWNPSDTIDFCVNNNIDSTALVLTKTKEGWGAVDLNMNQIIPNEYKKIEKISNNGIDYYVANKFKKMLVYSNVGKVVYEGEFDRIVSVNVDTLSGFVIICKDSLKYYSLLDQNRTPKLLTKELLDYNLIRVEPFRIKTGEYVSDGNSYYVIQNGLGEILNLGHELNMNFYGINNGKIYMNPSIVFEAQENNHYISFSNYLSSMRNELNSCGGYKKPLQSIISKRGKLITSDQFRTIVFSNQIEEIRGNHNNFITNEFMIVSKNDYCWYDEKNQMGMFDSNGNKILEEKYDDIDTYCDSTFILKIEDNKFQLFNPYTKKISPVLEEGNFFSRYNKEFIDEKNKLKRHLVILDSKKDKFGVLDNKFETILPFEYYLISSMDNIHYVATKNNEQALYDKNFKKIFDFGNEYEFINEKYNMPIMKGFIVAKNKKEVFIVNRDEKTIYKTDSINKLYYFKEDCLIRISKNNNTTLLDSNGSIILSVEADEVTPIYNNLALFFKNDKVGLINKKGEIKIPAIYNSISIEANSRNKPIIFTKNLIFTKNDKYGIIDTNNTIIADAVYDFIFSNHSSYALIVQENKVGVINNKGEITTPLTYNTVYSADKKSNYQSDIYKINEKDTTHIYGLLDNNFSEILDNKYKLIGEYEESCDCYPLIDTNNSITFLKNNEKIIIRESKEFKESYYGKRFYSEYNTKYDPLWEKQENIFGCDATAFYLDDKNNYWLGTGSSGGVYFSNDKGNTWIAKNKGIGPCHVSLIGKIDNDMYMEKDYKFIFRLNSEDTWEVITNHNHSLEIKTQLEEYAKINHNKIKSENKIKWKSFSDLFVELINEFSYDLYESKYAYFQLSNRNEFSTSEKSYFSHLKDSSLNEHTFWVMDKFNSNSKLSDLPDDILLLRSGNIFKENENSHIILGQSGVYRKNEDGIKRINENGIEATDIRQFVKISDKSIYALSGANAIWWFNGKNWSKVFDYYSNKLVKPDTCSESPQGIHQLNINDNQISFSMHGNIIRLDKKNKPTIIKSPVKYYGEYDTSTVLFESQIKTSGREYCVGVTKGQKQGIKRTIYSIKNGKLKPIYEGRFLQLYRDFVGNIWCYEDNSYETKFFMIVNDSTFENELRINRLSKNPIPNSFTVSDKNCLSILGNGVIHEYYYQTKKWSEINFEEPRINSIYDYDSTGALYSDKELPCESLTKTEDGTYFIGSGYYFRYGCLSWDEFAPNGLYQLCYNKEKHYLKKIENEPNKWILSLLPFKDGLMVGTSGSGAWYINTKKKSNEN